VRGVGCLLLSWLLAGPRGARGQGLPGAKPRGRPGAQGPPLSTQPACTPSIWQWRPLATARDPPEPLFPPSRAIAGAISNAPGATPGPAATQAARGGPMERFLVRREPAGGPGGACAAQREQHGAGAAPQSAAAPPAADGDAALHGLLQRYWGYRAFREPQLDVIRSALAGADNLVVMATGGGKARCCKGVPLAAAGAEDASPLRPGSVQLIWGGSGARSFASACKGRPRSLIRAVGPPRRPPP
jgi:hypothetical protein